jgi:hypothetical protein
MMTGIHPNTKSWDDRVMRIQLARELNPAQHINRQRFTIALELGQYSFHEGLEQHVDQNFRIAWRNADSSKAISWIEIQASKPDELPRLRALSHSIYWDTTKSVPIWRSTSLRSVDPAPPRRTERVFTYRYLNIDQPFQRRAGQGAGESHISMGHISCKYGVIG